MIVKQTISILILLLTTGLLHAEKYTAISKSDIQTVISKTVQRRSEGNFISFKTTKAGDVSYINIGEIPGFKRYSAAFRNKSCWMIPSVGDRISKIPVETQFLLIDRGNSNYLMLIPLVDGKSRCSISGTKSGEIELIAETGDSTLLVNEFLGLYLLSGTNPQQMIKQASGEIQQELKTFKLRREKTDPWFVNYFGWCTYNALYGNLSKDTLAFAMKNFKQKKIPVRYIIIDGGWQSNRKNLLNSFEGDKIKFPDGIAATITMLKNEYGMDKVFMWQTLWGMFMGLDRESFAGNAKTVSFLPPKRMNYLIKGSKGITEQEDTVGPGFYPGFLGSNIVIPSDFSAYYNDYLNYLRLQGADGVKIDAMTWIEAVGNTAGGRVKAMRDMMQGLQGAVGTHLNNEMINCSSCSNDYIFNTLSANVTRSSGDFFPDKPDTYGFHVFTNAHTSFWMGEIVLPDWDMFQSGHKSGAFHAAARAISGGPVYTTETIGSEDKTVLDKLMTFSGRLPRCKDVGRVCTESLFTDPSENIKAVKIYNINLVGGIVGAFNCSYTPGKPVMVTEEIKANEIENLKGNKFAVYQFSNDKLITASADDKIPVKLAELDFDLFTCVPVQQGFAPVGIVGKYNPGGMISEFNQLDQGLVSLKLLEGGKFIAWSDKKPIAVFANAKPIGFEYNNNKLEINVPVVENVILTIKFK